MKTINLTTLPALFLFCTGLIAQDAVDNPTAPPDAPEPAVTEQAENALESTAEDTELPVGEVETAIEEAEGMAEEVAVEVEAVDIAPATVTPIDENRNEYDFRGEIVTISNNSELGPGERSDDMVTIMGNSSSSGYVDGDMVTVLGNSTLDGYVDGDFVVVMGSAEFGPNAEVDGDVVVIGGQITKDPAADVDGETVAVPFFSPQMIEGFQDVPIFVRECIFLARPISPNVKFTFYVAGIFLLFYLLLAALFPKPLERSRNAIEERPFNAFLAGILVMACYIPFVIILMITVVGALLIPVGQLALLAIAIFGKAVVFFFIGRQIARAVKATFLEHPFFSVIIGGVIIYALYMIPFFGLFLWMILSLLGLGAVCLAIGESIEERKQARVAAMPTTQPASGTVPPAIPGSSEAGSAASPNTGGPVKPGTSLNHVDPAVASVFQRVGFWWRALATFIDLMLVGAITTVLSIQTPLIPLFAYFIILWGWRGSSLGGMALGLRVQKLSGEPLDWPTAIIRSMSSIVSFLPFCIGFFWAGWDPDNQSWHDKIAGTTVVKVPKGYTWS